MSDERVLRTLRAQSWQRAKGELFACLQTFWDGGYGPRGAPIPKDEQPFEQFHKAVEDFVKFVEDNGLTE